MKKWWILVIFAIVVILIFIYLSIFFTNKKIKSYVEECESMENETVREYCYIDKAMRLKEPRICNLLEYEKRRSCIILLGGKLSEKQINKYILGCEEEEGTGKKEECYIQKATMFKEFWICDLIESDLIKDICYNRIIYGVEDLDTCEEIKERNRKDKCFFDLCTFKILTHKSIPDACYNILDEDKCTEFYEEKDIDYCYSFIGMFKADIAICDKVFDGELKEICYAGVAEKNLDIEICGRIQSNYTKFLCYSRIAIGKNDTSICDYIAEEQRRENCINAVTKPEIYQNITAILQLYNFSQLT